MGPAELAWRVSCLVRDHTDALRIPLGLVPRLPPPMESFFEFEPGFHCSPVTPNALESGDMVYPASWRDRLIDYANQVLDDRLTYFDLKSVDHGKPFNWHRDFSAGIDAPVRLSVFTDYRDFGTYGDCKLVWEPNRHHQFVVLARAYVVTSDNKYANKIAELIRSWIDTNPYGYGMNWKSGLEHGIRIINWIWALDLIRDTDVINDSLWADIRQTIYLMTWDAHRRFSRGTSANNHLIGEAAGVYIACCYFPDMPNASKWRRNSQAILEKEILLQTYPDGCTKEHTFGYQLFVMQFLLLSLQAGEKSRNSFSNMFRLRLQSMYRFMAEVSADTARPPNNNDSDDGYVVDLGERPNDPLPLIAVGAYEFRNPDLASTKASESVFWLYGSVEQTNSAKHRESMLFRDSGYAILRSNYVSVFFDAATLGYGPIAAHGHADCLSIQLSVRGHSVFVDPGTYDYFSYPTWRNYFRKTHAHNTAVVDNKDQSQILGPFLWGHRAQPSALAWENTNTLVAASASHDGYMRLPDGVVHARKIAVDKLTHTVTIEDHFDCAGDHDIAIYFHIAPSIVVTPGPSGTTKLQGPGFTLNLSTPDGQLRHILADETEMFGWVSTGYHKRIPSSCLVSAITTPKTCVHRTIITIL